MKATFFITAFALVGSAIAAPTPAQMLQESIIMLENQIVYVINDMVQSSANLKSDYAKGMTEFEALVKKLEGSMPCAASTVGQPSTMMQAINDLHMSQENLILLSLALQNPGAAGEVPMDVCKAWDCYAAVAKMLVLERSARHDGDMRLEI